MPKLAVQNQTSRRAVRSERDRALTLLLILAAFIVIYFAASALLGHSGFLRLENMLLSLLTAMIGVGITVLVTTFSFVFVALSLVSVQFSPRVVRHFWHGDRFRRVFLWAFIAIFGFCFLVQFIAAPRLHLFALTLASYSIFVMFPVFLGYLADNINAASITQSIANRTVKEIARDYRELDLHANGEPSHLIKSNSGGFLEHIDTNRLLAVFTEIRAMNPGVSLKIVNYIGSFVEIGSMLATIEPGIEVSDQTQSELRKCFTLNKFRSIDQDIEYGIRQLVDIGVKAISPAVNDPTTCVNCIHYLGVIIKELVVREPRSTKSIELEKAGIFLREPSFEQYLDDAFDQIYQFGRRDHVIVRTIINVLTDVLSAAKDADRAATLVQEIDEMELASLYDQSLDSPFPLIENRNYVRRSLKRFYLTAAEKFSGFSVQDKAAAFNEKAELIESNLGR